MNWKSRTRIVASLGLSGLALSCVGGGPRSAPSPPSAGQRPRPFDGPFGGTGNNGLEPEIYNPRKADLQAVMGASVPPSPAAPLLTAPGGAHVFAYAIECALDTGHSVTVGTDTYLGRGLLSTTDSDPPTPRSWLSDRLAPSQRDDVYTCMTLRLNPFGVCVPIWLGGDHVSQTVADPCNFPYDEAVWLATESTPDAGGNSVGIHAVVWPLGDWGPHCDVIDGIKTRLCGTDKAPSSCDVEVRPTSLAKDCAMDPRTGYYTCLGKPAIRTKLTLEGWSKLYPCCQSPAPAPPPAGGACAGPPLPPGRCPPDPPDAGSLPDTCPGVYGQ